MFKWGLGICLLWCCLTSSVMAEVVRLKELTITEQQYSTNITLRLTGDYRFHPIILKAPPRYVIDLKNTVLGFDTRQLHYSHQLIRSVRIAKNASGTLRLVFDLDQNISAKTIPLSGHGHGDHTLSVILTPLEKKRVASAPVTITTPKPVVMLPQQKTRDLVVVIDPGHGGKDPGALGGHGSREKSVVLMIAKRLAELINKEPGMRAILTRQGDYYIGLRQRLNSARSHNADIFIAVHADAYRHSHSRGASVFALSPRGASSEAARWLAERENHSELGDVSLTDKSFMLRSVLLDLSQTATIVDSLQLGNEVLRNLSQVAHLHNRRVEQAPFVVLKSPDIPSILVETGFISNPDEEQSLMDPRYREILAQAITQGVKAYFVAHPPNGSDFVGHASDVA